MSNVSLQHEAPLAVLRRSPAFVRELVALLGHEPTVAGEAIIVEADLTKVTPTARRADLVSVIKGSTGGVRQVIVVEVQRDKGAEKPEAWLSYVAHLCEAYRAPVTLLVVAFDPVVAQWARGPHEVGPCVSIKPLVLAATDLPEVVSEADALAHPEQAMMTALARFERQRGVALAAHEQDEIACIFAAFAGSTNPLLSNTYASIIHAAADVDFRAILDRLWEAKRMEIEELIRNEGKAEGKAEGIAEGKAAGKAEDLLKLLRRRGFEVDVSIEQRVRAASDLAQLDAWFDRAFDAERVEDIFAH